MDPVIGKLSLKAASKVNQNMVPNVAFKQGPSNFDKILNRNPDNMIDVLEKLYSSDETKKSNMEVISASDIEVSLDKNELTQKIDPSEGISLSDSAYNAFKSASWDMNKLSGMIEKMANSEVDLPVRKLIKMQYMVGNMTTSIQVLSKIPEQLAQSVSQVMQTQV